MIRITLLLSLIFVACADTAYAQRFRRWRAPVVHRTYRLSVPPTAGNVTVHEQRLIGAVNRYRVERGQPALVTDDRLMRIARERVTVFHHRHPRYGWVHEHAPRVGFTGPVTDNLASGYPTPESAVGDATSGWGDERPGHTVGHNLQMMGYMKRNGQWVNRQLNRIGAACRNGNCIAVFGRDD